MPKVEVYYYPSGFGHTGVNVIFSKEEVPDSNQDEFPMFIYSKQKPARYREKACKLEARRSHRPVFFLQENGEYSIYGYKDGVWRETPLNNLSSEELSQLHELHFDSVTVKKNDKCFSYRYENGFWQEQIMPENHRQLGNDARSRALTKSSLLYNLMQKDHEFKRTEYFFDFGGRYDLEDNLWRGNPIRISLPPTTKDFNSFIIEAEENGYEYGRQPGEDENYHFFTNNCAHGSLDILHYAGYIAQKPNKRFGLLPFTVALKASDIAHQNRPAFRKQVLESVSKTNVTELVNTLLDLSENRLSDTIHFNYGKYIGNCSRELEKITQIKYDGSDVSIERLLKISEEASPLTANELEEAISLINPEKCFEASIARLEAAAKKLKHKGNAGSLQKIATELRNELTSFQKKQISHGQFTINCSKLIEKAQPIFKKESSIAKQILINIALAVCGLVAFYLIASFINRSNTGSFFFFNEPSLSKICIHMQGSANKLEP